MSHLPLSNEQLSKVISDELQKHMNSLYAEISNKLIEDFKRQLCELKGDSIAKVTGVIMHNFFAGSDEIVVRIPINKRYDN